IIPCTLHALLAPSATAPADPRTLPLPDALPICPVGNNRQHRGGDGGEERPTLCPHRPGDRGDADCGGGRRTRGAPARNAPTPPRSEEHTSELQSLTNLVCRLLLEKTNAIDRRTR